MKSTKNIYTAAFCRKTGTCYEGTKWALKTAGNMAGVWDACTRFDWLMWMLKNISLDEKQKLILRTFAIRIGWETPLADGRKLRDVLPAAVNQAMVVAQRYLNGGATVEELAAVHATFAGNPLYDVMDGVVYSSAWVDAYAAAAGVRAPDSRAFHVKTLKEMLPNPFLP